MAERPFEITFSEFNEGFAPVAHLNSLTELGGAGNASEMTDVDVLDPTYVTQGPGLANLTNATEAGALTEQMNFILDVPPADGVTYGIGDTKLFEVTPTAISYMDTITDCVEGESLCYLKGDLYYFYNTASGGGIGKYPL
jgi:hypothetical protein